MVVKRRKQDYIWALLICGLVTLLSLKITQDYELIIAMLYLLGIVYTAVRFGRGPSLLASFVSVAAFDFLFIMPSVGFNLPKARYIFTFVVMLVVSLLISNLTANLRFQMRIAMQRERRTKALYSLSKELSAALTMPQIVEISSNHFSGIFQSTVSILLPDNHDKLHLPLKPEPSTSLSIDLGIAQWVYDHHQPAGLGTDTLPAAPMLYLPLQAPMRTRGVVAICPHNPQEIFLPEQQRLLDTFVTQIALALERVHYVEVARDALLTMESERLRSYLLNSISQNLRSPLAEILELSNKLIHENLPTSKRDAIVNQIYEKTVYVNNLIGELK